MKKIVGVLALSVCALPCVAMADTLELKGFGSYIDGKADDTAPAPDLSPSGGGGGLEAKVKLPLTGLFISGEAQKNTLKDDNAELKLTNERIGLGTQFDAGVVSLMGNVNYVHYKGEVSAGGGSGSDNDDGFGVHVGADVGIGVIGVYGDAGYIKLSDGKGPEVRIGVRGTLLPIVGLFAEYRYTELKNYFGAGDDNSLKLNDFRVGVSISI